MCSLFCRVCCKESPPSVCKKGTKPLGHTFQTLLAEITLRDSTGAVEDNNGCTWALGRGLLLNGFMAAPPAVLLSCRGRGRNTEFHICKLMSDSRPVKYFTKKIIHVPSGRATGARVAAVHSALGVVSVVSGCMSRPIDPLSFEAKPPPPPWLWLAGWSLKVDL